MIDVRFYASSGPIALGELIDGLAVSVDPKYLDEMIESTAVLSSSVPGQISFLGSKKYKADLETAKATACFIEDENAALAGAAHIIPLISKTPKTHFGRVMNRLVQVKSLLDEGVLKQIPEGSKIHPTAIIAESAKIGLNVEIAPYAVVGPGVVIGDDSRIGAHSAIDCAVIGQSCVIKSHAVIGGRGFGVDGDEAGLLDLPHIGRVIMGDRVSVGSHSCIDRGFIGDTVIGNDVKIDNLVQIAHNVTVGDGTMMAAHVGLSGSCHIGRGVLMGGSVGLADHIDVGDGAKIAARAGVMHNVPAGEMWSGIPAMPIRDHMRIISATKKLIQKKK